MNCEKPVTLLRDGREVIGTCGTCSQCRAVRRRDVIGRALAESRDPSCREFTFTTLTYGHDNRYSDRVDHPHANYLEYSDVQKWIKRIRKRQIPGSKQKYRVRYMVAGEYGTLKGRAHWHALLFWQSEAPRYSTEERWSEDPFWTEGFTNWQKGDSGAVSYVAKYISKSNIDEATETCFHGSFKPLIGGEFFRQWAQLHVDNGLALIQGRKYQIAGSYTRQGKLFDYWMTPSASRFVVRCYLEAWAKKWPNVPPPHSRMVEKYLDDEAKGRLETLRDDAAVERIAVGGYVSSARRKAVEPSEGPPRGYECWFDDALLAFVAVCGDGRPELFWNEKAKRWARRVEPRTVSVGDIASPSSGSNDPLPDLPGEAPREFRRAADVPEFSPGVALDLSSRRKKPGERERYRAEKAKQYHQAMVASRMDRIAQAIKRLREE